MDMICRTCKEVKDENLFCKRGRTLDGKKGLCRKCKSGFDKDYRRRNKEKLSLYFKKLWEKPERRIKNREHHDIRRYGIIMNGFMEKKKCELCGMTNNESLKKWNQRLQVHHRDVQGRHNIDRGLKSNNDKNNLMILCKSCHPKVDNPLKDYTGIAEKIWESRRRNGTDRQEKE